MHVGGLGPILWHFGLDLTGPTGRCHSDPGERIRYEGDVTIFGSARGDGLGSYRCAIYRLPVGDGNSRDSATCGEESWGGPDWDSGGLNNSWDVPVSRVLVP